MPRPRERRLWTSLLLFLSLSLAPLAAADDEPAAVRPRSVPESISSYRFNSPLALASTSPVRDEGLYGEPLVADLVLSPLVLAVTVDGHVHALKRETGQWLWTLHDDGGAALGGISKEERARRLRAGDALGGALVKGVGRRRPSNATATASSTAMLELEPEEEEEIYVIEPHSAGDIYLYTPLSSKTSDAPGTLQKLPLSMTQLVSLSPFTFPSDSSRMFVGRKETKLVGVDLRSGRLVGVFGSGEGWCEWDEMREGRVRTENECDDEISRRPEDLLYMARTEYHLLIYSKSPYSLLQTLTYTTYSSSSLGSTLQSQWTRTPDSRYLQPMHDGSLVCFLSGVPGLQWTIGFDTPVVSVFDIASPPSTPAESSQPIMLEQPHPLPVEGLPVAFDKLQALPEVTFIGRIGDDLFAMSRENFPLVAFAPLNGLDKGPGGEEGPAEGGDVAGGEQATAVPCHGRDCLVGSHLITKSRDVLAASTLEPPPERLGIEAPPVSVTLQPSLASATTPNRSSRPVPAPDRSYVLARIYHPVKALSTERSAGIGLFLLAIVAWIYAKRLWASKPGKALQQTAQELGPWVKRSGKINNGSVRDEVPTSLLPSPRLNGSTLEWPPTVSVALLPSLVSAGGAPLAPSQPSSSPILRDMSKDLPPLPPVDADAALAVDDADGDSDGEPLEDTPKRKGRRRRGKKTKKGALKADVVGLTSVVLFPDMGIESELEALSLVDVQVPIEVDEAILAVVDPHVIGGLIVSETILGYGSHGTVVLRGEFQGRAVAVKRLLKDFVTIATHEVALLQESDDHPNVIRYFCKEQRDTFLYIALELCPASLYELIDQPLTFPELTRDLDLKKALRQITGGLRHLHKLKIVHRDIKPQNILVSPAKLGGVRMLISDFGLCKKLDLDESSFQQTVNHAAGSFGYRAPEVLRGQVDPNAETGTPSHSTMGSRNGSGSNGSGINTDPSMRLTRSIDIFSLGCIFYYVLTGGEHPFGGRYEREINILRGNLCLERLDGLGEEALEVQNAITKMVATDPRDRPTAEAVLLHPFFWNAQKRLLFICDASDRFEIMERDPPTATLIALEDESEGVVGDDWSKSIDRSLLDNLGKYRKYDGKSVRDLLRVLRNKKHHYQDLPENVRKNLGDLPGGFLAYFTSRFPRLLLHVYDVVASELSDEPMFASTFSLPDDEQ